MKSVLVILTQPNLTSLQINESLSATMVLATFGISVKVLLKDAALSLLNDQLTFDSIQHAFKIASNMVESFEFYDLTPCSSKQKINNSILFRTQNKRLSLLNSIPSSSNHLITYCIGKEP